MPALRVLVVDDSAITRALLVRTLSQAGFETLEANDGAEGAVVALRELPDIVITDIEMPTMDGYQLLHLLKSDPASADIPVLVLTSHGEAPSRYWGLRTGADSYLIKNHAPAELIGTVQRLAERRPDRAAHRGLAPQGPLDVLARVARHLDANLFQATLANALLERGMLADDFAAASEVAMVTVSEVADAAILAVGTAEPHAVTVHLLLREPLAHSSVERFTARVLEHLEVLPGIVVEVILHGEHHGQGELDPAKTYVLPLPLRGAGGVLALLPRDPTGFAQASQPLIERIGGHLALVLDNARLSERLRELSNLDSLTRVLNHRAIHERLAEELERGRRYGHPVAIVMCDLDHFKRINDTHGHLAGDAVLRSASAAIRQHLRATDSFGRYGGEEFLVVLPETDLIAAQLAAERLRLALEERRVPLPSGGEVGVTGSFGVAARIELTGAVTADALVSLADQRLYDAKAAGRNCVRP